MKATIHYKGQDYKIDYTRPLDISIPLKDGFFNVVNCFYAPPVEITPVKTDTFIGDTTQGGLLNFKNVKLNPHGNGTHTECVGHLSTIPYMLDKCLKQFFFKAHLLTVHPEKIDNGDLVITKRHLQLMIDRFDFEALVIRTLPNDDLKLKMNYSGNNPPYMEHEAITWLVNNGIEHLLIDLPSVDREEDGGHLLAHKAFWEFPDNIQSHRTISELIYVPNSIKDGDYFLNIQITALQMDASPSKPVLYNIEERD